jgi:ornithine cyclodeaminase
MRDNAQLLLLDKNHVEALLQPEAVLSAVREAFMLHSDAAGRVFPVVREKLSTGGVFGIKSGDVGTQGLLGFKAAGFWPDNRRVGGEPHQATILLFDPASGRPLCIIDGNAVTTMRTGAAGGLGLLQFARSDSTRLCIFGTGVQARIQTQFALRLLPGLRTISYLSFDGQRDPAFEVAIKESAAAGTELRHAGDGDAAVAASDIVITATPGGGPLFSLAAVRPGTHFNCVGSDTRGKRELPAGLLARSRLFVDDAAQARQMGETQWAPETPCTGLGDLLTGKATFTRAAGDITVFDLTGLALQDLTVARLLQQRAEESGTGLRIAWPW